jgi:hypothetical protein
VKQGCLLSPLIFKYRESLEPGFCGRLGIVAKSEKEMKKIMRNLRKYVKKKKLEVNVEKTKMKVFNKRKRKE